MKSPVIFDWLDRNVLSDLKIPDKCVLVLDKASYTIKLTDHTKRPLKSLKKSLLAHIIERWGRTCCDFPDYWTNNQKVPEI